MSNYREILAQAKQEKQKASEQESIEAGNPTSIQASEEEQVNLCVRVPKSWRTKVKAAAVNHDISLADLVVEAIDRYMEQEQWS
jgi:predicted HicB family RNase H-like nuclease